MMDCSYFEKDCEFVKDCDSGRKAHKDCPELIATRALIAQGHTRHCACRINFGDGECECKKGVKGDE